LATTKSAIKRARKAAERNLRNKAIKSRVKSAVSRFEEALAGGPEKREDALAALKEAVSELDRAAGKGVLHPNAVERKKSRLSKKFNSIMAG